MAKITASQARTGFGQLLDRVSRGEEILITKHDKPVARIIPEGRPLARIRRAAENLDALRARIAKRPGFKPISDKEIGDTINEGRPYQRRAPSPRPSPVRGGRL